MREGGRKGGSVSGENVGKKKDGSDGSRGESEERARWQDGVVGGGLQGRVLLPVTPPPAAAPPATRTGGPCIAMRGHAAAPPGQSWSGRDILITLLSVCDVSSGRPSPSPEPSLLHSPPPPLSTHKNQRQPVCKAFQASRTSCVLISANYGALLQPVLVVFNESQTIVKVWPEQREKKVGFFLCVLFRDGHGSGHPRCKSSWENQWGWNIKKPSFPFESRNKGTFNENARPTEIFLFFLLVSLFEQRLFFYFWKKKNGKKSVYCWGNIPVLPSAAEEELVNF